MSLSIGIVGLPNVGKSTLFNALTKNRVQAENYPFCTIDPNVGVVPVPDFRLEPLAKTVKTQKIVPAVVEFIDIAGIVKGANKGEGLGNKFLANIRECDAVVEVVRDFCDSNVVHVDGEIDPVSDIETIKIELVLKDLETVSKRLQKLEKDIKKNPKLKDALTVISKIKDYLEKGLGIREIDLNDNDKAAIGDLNLLTAKPHIYVLNVDEDNLVDSASSKINNVNSLAISAKIEAELIDLEDEEIKEYLREIGQQEPGLNILVKKCYALLGLQTFFTAGEKEVRAWTIKKGAKAPRAAGVIHTDFERGFIKADVIDWQKLVSAGGWVRAREQGKVRLEGKEYVVRDGDVMIFKFST